MKLINFLKSRQEQIKQKAKRLFFIQIFALLILVAYGLLIIGTFSYYFILGQEKKALDSKINFQKKSIEAVSGVETKQVYLKNKTANLKQILENAQNNQAIVEGFFELVPEGIEVKGFAVSEEGTVSFEGEATTFSSLKTLFDNMEKRRLGQYQIDAASVETISLGKEGGYSFSLMLYLRLGKKIEEKV